MHRVSRPWAPALLVVALGCDVEVDREPTELRSGSSSGGSGGSDTGQAFDCDAQPAAWPSGKEEIADAFADDKFAVRQCAWERVRDTIPDPLCSEDDGQALREILECLADPAEGYDPEVRARAQSLLDRFAHAEVTPDIGPLIVLLQDFPDVEIIVGGIIPDPTTDFSHCDVRVIEYVDGEPFEPAFVDSFGPSVTDACGNGSGMYSAEATLWCPADKFVVVVDCYNSWGNHAQATDEIFRDEVCGEEEDTGETGTGTAGSSSSG